MKIIGLVGRKASGKTTAFKLLSKHYPTHEVMIAEYLKTLCAKLFRRDLNDFNDPIIKEIPWAQKEVLTRPLLTALAKEMNMATPDILQKLYDSHENVVIESPRRAMQYVGTNIIRKLQPNIHIEKAIKKLDLTRVNVITDIRFWNEFEPFAYNKTFSFLPLYIWREDSSADLHESELYIEEIGKQCLPIPNDSGVSSFEDKVLRATEKFLSEPAVVGHQRQK